MITRKTIASFVALILGVVLSLTLTTGAGAQEKPAGKSKEDRLNGIVKLISKDTSTITVQKDNIPYTVVYNKDTKYTKVNKPCTFDEVKEGSKVVCLGKFDEKHRLVATRIEVRAQ